MVIIDSEEAKSPRGPRPVPPLPLAPPPYAPLSPTLSPPLPPPRSPGIRSPPSPFSAPASNFLTVKRDRADITGSWNINTSLAPLHVRSLSTGSESDAASEAASDPSASSSGTSISVPGSSDRPNLKLFSPRGKIDAAIRVSGVPRAWIEVVSRDEDVAVTFPPNSSGAPRPPIRLLARSTSGNVQVHLPYPFMGTLRVPSDTVLPPSLKSQSVVLSPSEPPIDRPPILDEPAKPKMFAPPSRAVTPTPPSPPLSSRDGRPVSPSLPPSPPLSVPRIETEVVGPDPVVTITAPGEGLQLSTATDSEPPVPATATVPGEEVVPPQSIEAPAQPPASPTWSPPPTPMSPLGSTLSPPTHRHHHRSVSLSSLRTGTSTTTETHPLSLSRSHSRSPSRSSITHPIPIPIPHTYDASESSTVYFIGDLLHSSYSTHSHAAWSGDEVVIDSEKGCVRVCFVGEKAESHWSEGVKEVVDWKRWKGSSGRLRESGARVKEVVKPMISVGGLGRKLGFGK